MTLSSTAVNQAYTATASQTLFTITDFAFYDDDELLVYIEGALVDSADYTVEGGDGSTGSVTLDTGATLDERVLIERETNMTQVADIVNSTVLPTEAIETSLDRRAMNAQENEFKANPYRELLSVGANQAVGGTTNTDITDLSGATVPGANGRHRFRVRGLIQVSISAAGEFIVAIQVNDSTVASFTPGHSDQGGRSTCPIDYEWIPSLTTDTLDVQLQNLGAETATVRGTGVSPYYQSSIEILHVPVSV